MYHQEMSQGTSEVTSVVMFKTSSDDLVAFCLQMATLATYFGLGQQTHR